MTQEVALQRFTAQQKICLFVKISALLGNVSCNAELLVVEKYEKTRQDDYKTTIRQDMTNIMAL